MNNNLSIDTVIGEIYEASYNPGHWPVALSAIARFTHSDSAAILYKDHELERACGTFSYNIPDEFVERYNSYGIDPNFIIMSQHVPVGKAAAIDRIIPDRNELKTIYGDVYNNQFVTPDIYHVAGAILFMDDICTAGLGLQRRQASGIWQKNQINKLDKLIPHIQRTLNIQREFVRLQVREQALHKGLDKLLMGLILFDNQLNPIYINPVAKSILNYHPAIELRNNRIYAHKSSDTHKIHSSLVKAISADTTHNNTSTALGLSHPDSLTVLPVIITPAHNITHDFDTNGRFAYAAMSFSDPNKSHSIDSDKLIEIYRLTPAEAQVTIGIANGASADVIASIHEVATSTVRSQIKSIYQKVGVNSQVELVKTVLTGPFIQSI